MPTKPSKPTHTPKPPKGHVPKPYTPHEAASASRSGAAIFLPWPPTEPFHYPSSLSTCTTSAATPSSRPRTTHHTVHGPTSYGSPSPSTSYTIYGAHEAAKDAQAGSCFVAWPGDETYYDGLDGLQTDGLSEKKKKGGKSRAK